MAPRNPSELARLDDEMDYWRGKVRDLGMSKTSRQVALINLRHIQRQLGLELTDEV